MQRFNEQSTKADLLALANLIEAFDHFRVLLEECDYTKDEDEYFEIMSNMWTFRAGVKDENIVWLFEHSEFYQKYKSFFTAHEHYYMRAVELINTLSIITEMAKSEGVFTLIDGDIMQNSYSHVNEELKLLNTEDCKELVMVGCGSYPETILYLHENIQNAHIIGLDENQESVYMAGKIVKDQNLERISLLNLKGSLYDYSDTDIVYIANFVMEKQAVLDRIVETAPDHVQIIVRAPKLLGRLSYDDPLRNLNPRLLHTDETMVNDYFLYSTLLLNKASY
jgi:hypothetical protein